MAELAAMAKALFLYYLGKYNECAFGVGAIRVRLEDLGIDLAGGRTEQTVSWNEYADGLANRWREE